MTNLQLALTLIPIELWSTIYMVFASTLLAIVFGFPLGIILTLTDKGHLKPSPFINRTLGGLVNIGRSFPFAILMVALIPFTRFIIGTSLGTVAAIVPLAVAATPFVARIVESALKEVDKGMIEAALVMGSSTWEIVYKVLIPESLPSLVSGLTTTVINVIGYSAMAGMMGGGGLGKVAIQYGYQRFNVFLVVTTVIILIILVQGVQSLGNYIVRKINTKRGRSVIQ
jgi:D-methionine transport system permease protein